MTGPIRLPSPLGAARRFAAYAGPSATRPSTLLAAALVAALAAPAPGRAEEAAPTAPPLVEDAAPNAMAEASGYLIAGVGNVPSYVGSPDRRSTPFFITRFRRPRLEVSLEGLDWYLDALPSRVWRAGPTVSFELPRDEAVATGAVAALDPLGYTASPGLYLGVELPNDLLPEGLASARVAWRTALGGAREGHALTVDVDYFFAPLFFWRVGAAANAVAVDGDWAGSRFDIGTAGAAASGLAPHAARGGLYSVGASLYTILSVSQRFGVFGRWAVSRLRGGAAASPIVRDAGREDQRFSGVGLFYLFR